LWFLRSSCLHGFVGYFGYLSGYFDICAFAVVSLFIWHACFIWFPLVFWHCINDKRSRRQLVFYWRTSFSTCIGSSHSLGLRNPIFFFCRFFLYLVRLCAVLGTAFFDNCIRIPSFPRSKSHLHPSTTPRISNTTTNADFSQICLPTVSRQCESDEISTSRILSSVIR
jgi:hypothetical protein